MQVRMLKNIGTRDRHLPQLKAGEVFAAKTEVEEKTCDYLIRRGLAESIRAVPKQPSLKGVPTTTKANEAEREERE